MKKTLLVFVFAIWTICLHAQDLIILNNGEKIEAKVVEVSLQEVKYKKWSNLSGPLWVKKASEIERIKYQKDRFLKEPAFIQEEFWDFSSCSSSPKQPKNKKCVSGNDVVKTLNGYYDNSQWDKIQYYVDHLPSCVHRECIHQYYLERFYFSCDNEDADDIIKNGEIYLKTGGQTELPKVLPIVAKMYAVKGDETATGNLIKEFERYSLVNDELFETDIDQLRQETYDLLHPRRLEDEVIGTWVNIEDFHPVYGVNNPMILIIKNITIPTGANLIKTRQPINLVERNGKESILLQEPVNTSQGISFNGKTKLIALQFASEKIKDRTWLTDIASIGTEGTRQLNANMTATILASNAPVSEKFTTNLMTGIALKGIENLFSELSYSSKKIENYSIVLTPESNNSMEATMWHVEQTIDNDGHVYNGDSFEGKETHFVRWEDNDNLLFVSWDKKPITLHPVAENDPILDEFKSIKRESSFWRPQYSIPFFVGNAAGVYMMYASINTLIKTDNELKFGILFGGGFATILVSSLVPTLRASDKRELLFNRLNKRNLEKLKSKYNTEVSFLPIYDPNNNAFGASVNLSF